LEKEREMEEKWGIMGQPLSEVLAEAKELKEAGERRVLSVNWLQGEYWGKNNDVATKDSVRVFANAIGDGNPLSMNPEYAKQTIFGCIIAPPLYLGCIATGWGATVFRRVGNDWVPALRRYIGFNAGSRWARFQEVREGDSFTVYDIFKGMEERKSHVPGAPPMVLSQIDRTYVNQRGEVAAINSMRVIAVATPLGQKEYTRPANVADISQPYKYTDEELEAIERAYLAEERRGANTRYWEDVVEGEELKPVVKGPVITDDAVAFIGAVGLMQRAYGLRLLLMDKERRRFNPEDNTPAGLQTGHVYDGLLQGQPEGGNMPTIAGAQVETWLGHLITNWMGDEGFLKALDSQHRRVARFRHTYWCHGKVAKKYIEGGEHLVDLDLWTENQQAIKHTFAKASVRLHPRR
jgi:acyl dehydratase